MKIRETERFMGVDMANKSFETKYPKKNSLFINIESREKKRQKRTKGICRKTLKEK